MKIPAILFISLLAAAHACAQDIYTLAGTGVAGYSGDGAMAADAQLNGPFGIAADTAGNIYIADRNNNCIRKVAPTGLIITIAGNGTAGYSGDGGAAIAASLNGPTGVATDDSGNVYIADKGNNRIRKVNASGIITTLAGNGAAGYTGEGGAATAATLNGPRGVARDHAGNLFIADAGNHCIRKVNASGIINTVAGDGTPGFDGDGGPASAAHLHSPYSVCVAGDGGLLICDIDNERIRRISNSGIISTVAGNGTAGYSGDGGDATAAALNEPINITTDSAGNIYIADGWNQRIRKIDVSGTIITIAGNGAAGYSGDGGPATGAQLNNPYGVATYHGRIFIADNANNRIRYLAAPNQISSSATTATVDLFPNPTHSTFSIFVGTNAVQQQAHLTMYEVGGRISYQCLINTNELTTIAPPTSVGLYMVSIELAGAMTNKTLVMK